MFVKSVWKGCLGINWDILQMTLIRVWRIFGYSNIFEYFPVRIFVRIIFVSFFYANIFGYSFVLFFWYEYIRIFVRIIFLMRIYSDIPSYRFWFEYIQEKNLTFAPTGPKDKWLKLFTQRLMFKEKLLQFCCVNYISTFCCITHQKSNL